MPLERTWTDIRQALRAHRTTRGASALLVLVQALGIGLLTAMFGVADPFLTRPLPFDAPHELVAITTKRSQAASVDPEAWLRSPRKPPAVEEWEQRDDLFQAVAGVVPGAPIRLQLSGRAGVLRPVHVTREFFDVLRVSGALSDKALPGEVVLTTPAAQRLGYAAETILGRTLVAEDGRALRVAGVLGPGFLMPQRCCFDPPDALLLVDSDLPATGTMLGRLQPHVTREQVRAALASSIDESQLTLAVDALHAHVAAYASGLARGAMAAGVLVLLVCIASFGNLLAARSLFRTPELLTRRALGASRRDFLRLLVTEAGVTTVLALGLGVTVAATALTALGGVMPIEYATLGRPSMTGRVVVFACGVASLLMVAALVPALLTCRWSLRQSRATPVYHGHLRMVRTITAGAQVALALLLLAGAVFLGRSYAHLLGQDTGYSGNVVALTVSYSATTTPSLLSHVVARTSGALANVGGASAVAAAWGPMVDRTSFVGMVHAGDQPIQVTTKYVTAEYFDAIGSRLIMGSTRVSSAGLVVNQTLARQVFGDTTPVGQSLRLPRAVPIIGMVTDELDFALDRPATPTIYLPLDALPGCGSDGCTISYLVRLPERRDIRAAAARMVTDSASDAVVVDGSLLRDRLAMSTADRAFATLVLGLFATVSVAVALAGVGGMVALGVGRRTHEIAIRMAIGARPLHVLWLVLRDTAWACAGGLAIGAWLGYLGSLTLERLLFGVEAGDAVTLGAAAVLMAAVACVAALIPAGRALRIPAQHALRME